MVRALAEGIATDQSLEPLRGLSLQELTESFTGRFDRNQIAEAIVCNGNPGAAHVQWLRNWVLTADEGLVRKFLRDVTGREVLMAGERINLVLVQNPQGRIHIHTCFNSIDLPAQIATEQDLKDGLEASLAAADERFNDR